MVKMQIARDPRDPMRLTGCGLDDYAGDWARRLLRPASEFGRRDAEPDADYRLRLFAAIQARIEGI